MLYWIITKKGGEYMNSKILITVVVLLVVGIGAFMIFGNNSTAPTTTDQLQEPTQVQESTPSESMMEQQESTTVTLTETGFSPKDITVKAGTTITWINQSGKAATVHSDDHPTHRLHSFLNLGEFADGESLEVVVQEPETYGYHDHYNASANGTITVE